MAFLALNTHQENMPWHKYQWRLCMSYQKRNQITFSLAFPVPFCVDLVQDVDIESKYLFQWIWTVGILKYRQKRRRDKAWHYTPLMAYTMEFDAYWVT